MRTDIYQRYRISFGPHPRCPNSARRYAGLYIPMLSDLILNNTAEAKARYAAGAGVVLACPPCIPRAISHTKIRTRGVNIIHAYDGL